MFPYNVSRSYCYILSASITLLTIKYIAQFGVSYEPVSQNRRDLKDDAKLSDFYKTWCEVRRYRKDWEKIREPCQGLIKWGATKEGWNETTDAAKSVIISKDIRPTCKFFKWSKTGFVCSFILLSLYPCVYDGKIRGKASAIWPMYNLLISHNLLQSSAK